MAQRERGSRPIGRRRPARRHAAVLVLWIIVLGLLVTAPYAAYSQAPGPTVSGTGTIDSSNRSVAWEGPTKTTNLVGRANNNWDHYYLTVDSRESFRIRIAWDDSHNNFDLIVYEGHIDPKANRDDDVGREDGFLPGRDETLTIPASETQEYTIRVIYHTVVDSGYQGSAFFLDGGVVHTDSILEFGPASVVSAHFLGTEPMVTMERHIPGKEYDEPDPIDADRIFVDWPLTSRGQIGQVSRSLDGGQSFRLLFDPGCPERSRPGCLMGGGSDTMTEVDLFDGTLYFADQAAIIGAESLASSTDHGDTFPEGRQFAITSEITATDRQWLVPLNGVDDVSVGSVGVKAFLAYHVPFEGQYVHGINEAGAPIPQPVPQLTGVVQSGHPRVDTSEAGPARGWIYQPYSELGAEGFVVRVATAYGPEYQRPDQWRATTVTTDTTTSFPWLDIDSVGNAYLVWAAKDGGVYYRASPIKDDANNPEEGGRPGRFWTPPLKLTPPEITSATFAEVVAGDEGRIAITYVGSTDQQEGWTGLPDLAPATASWNTYAAVITDALQQEGLPEVTTGRVSHRPIHKGNICSAGLLFCDIELEEAGLRKADRSLADMIDIGVDEAGRIGVVFADNNNSLPWQSDSERARPFAHFAKLAAGPSLFEDEPAIDLTSPTTGADAHGDSTWPNITATRSPVEGPPTYLPALDALDAELSLERDDVVARLKLETATQAARKQDLAAFEEKSTAIRPAERLHYMVRFATADDVYHLSMESDANGTPTFFGGRLDDNDELRVGGDIDTLAGAAYNRDDVAVTGSIEGNTLVIRAPAAGFGVSDGTDVFSVTGFTMGGPAEDDVAVFNPMRTVDATPPFDATLSAETVEPSPSITPSVSPSGTPTTAPSQTPTPTPSQDESPPPGGGSSSGGGSASSPTPTPTPRVLPASVVVTPDEARSEPGARHEIIALVKDASGAPIPGAAVDWSMTGVGSIASSQSTTDDDGRVRSVLSSDTVGDQFVTASTGACAEGGSCVATAVTHWGSRRCDVFGTAGNDLLEGTDSAEVICGFGGHDVILGGGGSDVLLGGSGNDRLYGGRGADVLRGGFGDDEVRGGRDADRLFGGRGDDRLLGGPNRDRLRGGRGRDEYDGRQES